MHDSEKMTFFIGRSNFLACSFVAYSTVHRRALRNTNLSLNNKVLGSGTQMLYLPKLKHEGNGQTIRLLRTVSVEQLLVLVRGPQMGFWIIIRSARTK
jgi:hypothetical protein